MHLMAWLNIFEIALSDNRELTGRDQAAGHQFE
jgi:hypothetical protein